MGTVRSWYVRFIMDIYSLHLRPQGLAVLNRSNRQNWMRGDVFRCHYPNRGLMIRNSVVMIQKRRQDSLENPHRAHIIA